MSVGDLKHQIREGLTAVDQGRQTLLKALSDAERATALAEATLQGSNHELVREGLSRLRRLRGEVERTLAVYQRATELAEAYLARLG